MFRKRWILERTWTWLAVSFAVAGCEGEPRPWEVMPTAPPSTTAAPGEASKPTEVPERVELLRFSFATDVRHKEPTDELQQAQPGDRVYAHVAIRNRTGHPRRIHLDFSVNGKERTQLDLEVEHSWSFRTWGYNTILDTDDVGELRLRLTNEAGELLSDERLPIGRKRKVGPAKPPPAEIAR